MSNGIDISALFDLSYGLYILGVADQDKLTGCVVNTVFQVTSEPVTLAVSVNHDNHTNACIKKAGVFTVSILAEQFPQELIGLFGYQSGLGANKFESVDHRITESGAPVLTDDICGYLVCRVMDAMETPTHTLFLAQVEEAVRNEPLLPPMTYAYYHAVRKAKAPKNAPTYVADAPAAPEQPAEKWVCSICGYEYDGEIPFESLPDSYVCPLCGAAKSFFEKQS